MSSLVLVLPVLPVLVLLIVPLGSWNMSLSIT
jgi:hypothetical protein